MPPFLTAEALAAMFRPLTAAEALVAAPLLELASDWIREHKPGIAADDPAARLVCFEVCRDMFAAGKYGPFAEFSETVAHRSRSGKIRTSVVDKLITDRHRRLLGLSVLASPAYSFAEFDY